MSDPVLVELAYQILELAYSPDHLHRRRLWASVHALTPERPLVHYAMYTHVWECEIADRSFFHHQSGIARQIETQLRARIWKADHIPDDEPVLPTVWLWAPHPPGEERLWGFALPMRHADLRAGAYKPIPPIAREEDIHQLHLPPYEEDANARNQMENEARELLGDLLPVKFHTDEIHFGPFEWVVRMRGMDQILYDVYDRPAFLHSLMDFASKGVIGYHKARESACAIDAEASWGFHTVYDDPLSDPPDRLKGCWVYCHAQSSASFSPTMYAEFVQPYNERVADLFGRVYYHGCEDLSAKCAVIAKLPNLRLFHVGPWTPVEPVVRTLGNRFALEIHSHPTNVLFGGTPEEIRAEMQSRHKVAEGVPHVLKLCDVETLDGNAEKLRIWAEQGREVVG